MSNLCLVQSIPAREGSQTLTVSVIAAAVQVLNNFVLGRYEPAWDRRNKLSFKRPDVSAFYQVCLIFFCVKCNVRILAHRMQMQQFWFLSGMPCPGNLENKSQTFGGGFIIIPISELALQDYLVLMSKPVSSSFQKGRFPDGFPALECAGGSKGWQVRALKSEVHPHSNGRLCWICGDSLRGVLVSKTNVLQEY